VLLLWRLRLLLFLLRLLLLVMVMWVMALRTIWDGRNVYTQATSEMKPVSSRRGKKELHMMAHMKPLEARESYLR
jgi:hypothetical protein